MAWAVALMGWHVLLLPRGGLAAGGRLHGPPQGPPAWHGSGGCPVQLLPHPLLLHEEEPVSRQPPGIPQLCRPPRGDKGRACQDQAAAAVREYRGVWPPCINTCSFPETPTCHRAIFMCSITKTKEKEAVPAWLSRWWQQLEFAPIVVEPLPASPGRVSGSLLPVGLLLAQRWLLLSWMMCGASAFSLGAAVQSTKQG